MAEEQLKLNDAAQAAFERALDTGSEKDVVAATRAIYEAARETIDAREAHEDPVVLAFLIEMAGRIRKIEERVGVLLPPPKRD